MFTGIIEKLGTVKNVQSDNSNLILTIASPFTSELKVDQSIAHNGVCLTVTSIDGDQYKVTAIDETLKRTNLGSLKSGDKINLERCMILGARLDGHIVQGHVDTVAEVTKIEEQNGSWLFYFRFKSGAGYVTVEKGSVCVNGVSLTVVDSAHNTFSVAIIPYTWENTNFHSLRKGDFVNIEFDIIGKYVARLMNERK
ncbi:MAG TPA: riboflavin synthase [Bacteroidia bacterium]|nr:riboflavin synthase [Bacteroidia bacterium]